jgi:hypothetical protein
VTAVDPFDRELEAFSSSDWGRGTTTPSGAAGLCKRATLALLARLDAAGLAADVELWTLTGAVGGRGRGAHMHGTHWVLVRNGEVIDVSARQFDPDAEHIQRGPTRDEFERWHDHEFIDPDGEDMWDKGFLRRKLIPPYWRNLLKVGPPGDLPGWPYPRQMLDPSSPWHAPPSS